MTDDDTTTSKAAQKALQAIYDAAVDIAPINDRALEHRIAALTAALQRTEASLVAIREWAAQNSQHAVYISADLALANIRATLAQAGWNTTSTDSAAASLVDDRVNRNDKLFTNRPSGD